MFSSDKNDGETVKKLRVERFNILKTVDSLMKTKDVLFFLNKEPIT